MWFWYAVVSHPGKKCLFPFKMFSCSCFHLQTGVFRWVYMQINAHQYFEHSFLLVVIWNIPMLYTFHQSSPNNFSEIFITPEVASLLENHASLLVLAVFQDNRIILWDSGDQMLFSVAFTVRWWVFQSEFQLGLHFTLIFTSATFLPSSTAPFGLGHGSSHMPGCGISVFGIRAGLSL